MNRRRFIVTLTLALFMGGSQAFGIERDAVNQKITSLLQNKAYQGMEMSIHVYSLKKDAPVFSKEEHKILKPASNLKLVTTLAALKYLGADYKFKTKLYTDGKIEGDTLKGNLYIKGFGDPKLVSEQLWFLTNDLKRLGFQKVQGALILDESFFDDKRTVRNGSHGGQRAYDAPLGALSINFNTTAIYVQPGNQVGEPAKVIVDPTHDYIRVINQSKTTAGGKKEILVIRLPKKTHDVILVKGKIPLGAPEKRYYRNISHPLYYAASMFRRFFKEQGISVLGKNRFEATPLTVKEILTYESRPLRILVSDLNKISNNFIAEQILKTMAAELKGTPGSTDKGLTILGEFLKGLGIQNGYTLVNGSGLSYDNKMSAAQLVEVLKYGYREFKLFPEYVSSMGIMGVDGTVKDRLKGTLAAGRIRAKTGSLKGVVALSGYLLTQKQETLAFSMIMNDTKNRDVMMETLQNEILLYLCQLEA